MDDDRQAELARRARAARRRAAAARASVARRSGSRARPRRPRRHRGLTPSSSRSSSTPVRLGRRRLVRVDPERRVDAVVCAAIASARRHDSMPVPIVITRRDACLAGSCEGAARILERIEVRVRVDHTVAPRRARRCAGRAAGRPRSRLPRRFGRTRRSPKRRRGAVRAQRGCCRVVSGRYAASAIAATRRPSARSKRTRSSSSARSSALASSQGLVCSTYRFSRADEFPDSLERAGDVECVECVGDEIAHGFSGLRQLGRPVAASPPARRRGSGQSSPSSARAGCRGRCRARPRSVRGSCRA